MTEQSACVVADCFFISDPATKCARKLCPFAPERRSSEDRVAREEADRGTRMEAGYEP